MLVEILGEEYNCHCPTTGRIGNVELKNIPCLCSVSKSLQRKTPYTVEAISVDGKNWIGINQILSNKLVEFFLKTNQLNSMISNVESIKREVKLGNSKLDFLVGNTYIEVKSPLTTLHVNYDSNIKEKKVTPFSSTDRFVKHIKELTDSLNLNERAILLTVYQYEITNRKEHQKSTNYDEVSYYVEQAIEKGLEMWELTIKFEKDGITLKTIENITNNMI